MVVLVVGLLEMLLELRRGETERFLWLEGFFLWLSCWAAELFSRLIWWYCFTPREFDPLKKFSSCKWGLWKNALAASQVGQESNFQIFTNAMMLPWSSMVFKRATFFSLVE